MDVLEIIGLAKQIPMRATNTSVRSSTPGFAAMADAGSFEGQFQRMAMMYEYMSQRHAAQGVQVQLLQPPQRGLPSLLERAQSREAMSEPRGNGDRASGAQLALQDQVPHVAGASVADNAPQAASASVPSDQAGLPQQVTSAAPETNARENDKSEAMNPVDNKKGSLSLKESIGRFKQAKEASEAPKPKAAVMKKPVAKTQKADPKPKQLAKQAGGCGVKAKKPVKKAASKPKAKAARKRVSGEEKRAYLETLPKKILQQFKSGCARCRWAPYCTYSCWKLRGW